MSEEELDIVERLRKISLRRSAGFSIKTAASEAADEIERLRASPAQAAVWQPIASAPRDGTIILLGNKGSEPTPAYWGLARKVIGHGADKKFPWVFLDVTNGINHRRDDETGPSHWMPLPSPPPQTSPVPSTHQSAPDFFPPRNSGERLPSSDAAGSGADTCSVTSNNQRQEGDK